MNEQISARYFAGANAPCGFYSRFNELIDPGANRRYIIKGGPGTGKSTLMRMVAVQLAARGCSAELVHCSSDPDSLDAVVFPSLGAAIVDGTAPHVIDPVYPGVTERILNLGDHWDAGKLRERRADIVALVRAISAEHAAARRCIAAASILLSDSAELASRFLLTDKLESYCTRFAKKRFPKPTGHTGTDTGRFLTAISPVGFVSFAQEMADKARQVVLVDDLLGTAPALLDELRRQALKAGCDTYSYYCPLSPADKLEHIYIPAAGLFITTRNAYHACESADGSVVHMTRFFNEENRRPLRARFSFNRRAARALLEEGVERLTAAKRLHDELEEYYVGAMDFDKNRQLAKELAEEIISG